MGIIAVIAISNTGSAATDIHTAVSPSSVAGPLILSDNYAEARPARN